MVIQYPDDFNKAYFKQRFSKPALRKLAEDMRVPNTTQALFLLDRSMTVKRVRQICGSLGVEVRIGNYPTGMTIKWDDFHATLEEHGIVQASIAKAIGMSRAQFCVLAKNTKTTNSNVRIVQAIAETMHVNIIVAAEQEHADT